MAGYLIKDTTKEERRKIVEDSLGSMGGACDGCAPGIAEMYQPYIDGLMEISECNMNFNAHYEKGDMEKPEKSSCMM